MSRIKDEKPIFSEIFYRSEKRYIEKIEKYIIVALVFVVLALLVCIVYAIRMIINGCNLFEFLMSPLLSGVIVGFFALWVGLHILNILEYIVIFPDRIKIVRGTNKWIKSIPKKELRKVAINLKNKRVEIYLNDGRRIYLKHSYREEIKHRYLSYEQFERFKKAMKEIGVEYEVIYA